MNQNNIKQLAIPLIISASSHVYAATYNLDMSTLPSAQGWYYDGAGNSVPEQQVFSVDGTALHQDSSLVVQYAPGGNRYNYYNALVNGQDWSITVTAKLISESNSANFSNNHWGFAFGLFDPDGYDFGVGLGNGIVMTSDGYEQSLDTTQTHVYRLESQYHQGNTPAFNLYVDGELLTSGMANSPGCTALGMYCNSLYLGDGTSGPNAIGDFYSYSLIQTPIPAAAGLFSSTLVGLWLLGWKQQKRLTDIS